MQKQHGTQSLVVFWLPFFEVPVQIEVASSVVDAMTGMPFLIRGPHCGDRAIFVP